MRLTLHLCVGRAIPELTLYVSNALLQWSGHAPNLTFARRSGHIPNLALYVRLFKCFVAMVGPCAQPYICVSVGQYLT